MTRVSLKASGLRDPELERDASLRKGDKTIGMPCGEYTAQIAIDACERQTEDALAVVARVGSRAGVRPALFQLGARPPPVLRGVYSCVYQANRCRDPSEPVKHQSRQRPRPAILVTPNPASSS